MPTPEDPNGRLATRVDLDDRPRRSVAETAIDPLFLELRALRSQTL
jgi:hypothetical protein